MIPSSSIITTMSKQTRDAFARTQAAKGKPAPAPSANELRAQAVKKLEAAQKLIEEAMSLNARADEQEKAQ